MELTFPLTMAYNIDEKKVGCVLIQPILGGTLPGNAVAFYFDTSAWELNPSKCKVYTVPDKETFDKIVNITKNR